MKKKLSLLMTILLTFVALVGCYPSVQKDPDGVKFNSKFNEKKMTTVTGQKVKIKDNEQVVLSKTSGFAFVKPKSWSEISKEYTIDGYDVAPEGYYTLYMPEEQADKVKNIDKEKMTKEEISKIKQEVYDSEFNFFVIYRVNEDEEETVADAEVFKADFEYNDQIGVVDKNTFYFAYNDKLPEDGFSDSDKKNLQIMIDSIKEVKDNIILFPPTDPMDDFKASMEKFTSKDIAGNEVNQDIFKDYDVTMVNVWATWCKYCIQEIPEIEALYEELPEKTNILTICTDMDTQKDLAKELLDKTGAKFTTIASCEEIEKNVLEYVTGYPTTFFVNSKGKVIGKLQIGTPAEEGKIKDAYMEILKEVMEGKK